MMLCGGVYLSVQVLASIITSCKIVGSARSSVIKSVVSLINQSLLLVVWCISLVSVKDRGLRSWLLLQSLIDLTSTEAG